MVHDNTYVHRKHAITCHHIITNEQHHQFHTFILSAVSSSHQSSIKFSIVCLCLSRLCADRNRSTKISLSPVLWWRQRFAESVTHESNNHGVERHHEERNDIAASPGTRTRASHVNSFDCASGDTAVQESRKSARLRGLERWLYRRTGGGTVQLASAHRRSVCEGQKGCSIDVECACHTIWCRRRQRRS